MNSEERDADRKAIVAVLLSGGTHGNLSEWYGVLKYAQQLNIPPWEVEQAALEHGIWFERVHVAREAEQEAEHGAKRQARFRQRLNPRV